MAFKRVYHRADFDSNLSQSQREQFVDDAFDRWVNNGIDGVIVEYGGCDGVFILEGDARDVGDELQYLNNASELLNNQDLHTDTSGTSSGHVVSHMHSDNRDYN